jgi:hypothetical protein
MCSLSYELGFYIPEGDILDSYRLDNFISYIFFFNLRNDNKVGCCLVSHSVSCGMRSFSQETK